MRILDEETKLEITEPDLSSGVLLESTWVSPEAYETVDNKTKFALDDSDYESVFIYHRFTDEEIAQREHAEAENERQEIIDALPDAVAELSMAVSDGAMDASDLADALAELSEVVSGIMEVINNG